MTKPQTDLKNCPHCAFKAPTMIPIYGCPCSCHQAPQTEPKNASKGVSRCPDDTTEAGKPIIPQTEQKIDRGQWTGYPKIIVGGIDWQILDILKRNHSPKDCPHEGNCLNDRNALEAIKAILTASNRASRIDEVSKIIVSLERVLVRNTLTTSDRETIVALVRDLERRLTNLRELK